MAIQQHLNINLTIEELALLEDIIKGYSWWFEDRVLSGTHTDENNRLSKTQDLASRLKAELESGQDHSPSVEDLPDSFFEYVDNSEPGALDLALDKIAAKQERQS